MLAYIGIALVSFFIGLLFGCFISAMCIMAQDDCPSVDNE